MARKKTERIYTKITDMRHFATKLREFGDSVAYRFFDDKKEIVSMSYAQLSDKFLCEAAGLYAMGLAGKRIAVIGETSVEWVASYVAIIAAGGIAIPMDKELEVSEIEGFLTFAEADAIIFSSSMNTKFEHLAAEHPTIQKLIPIKPLDAWSDNDRIIPYDTLMEKGLEQLKVGYEYPEEKNIDRMAEMLFTSGTTGTSKCVMLSQRNIFAAVNSACETVDFSANDRIVSVLPIHHTYELCIMLAGLNYGMNIAINDSVKRVLRNFALFQPTGLVLVPLYVTTMNKKVWDEAKKGKKDGSLRTLIKLSRILRGVGIDARRKLFKPVLSAFGGSLNKIICGGAQMNVAVADTFSEFGIDIYEGYGITECSPLIAVSPYFAPKKSSVGPSVPSCQTRIAKDHVNDKGFDEGEIQVKGDNVMLGYYKNDEATAAAFTEDGWFRTGDVGYMDKDGYIYITGRMKFVVVLDNGKNVFPEEVEEYINELDSVCENVVLGRKNEQGETILTTIVYPQMDQFKDMAKEEIEKKINDDIVKMNHKLVSYKQIRAVEFRYEPFEKTTSRKIKRHLVK